MDWNFQADQPIYLQLKRYISEAIVTGVYLPGQRLPSVRELAMEAGVNPNTVQRALAELEREELVCSLRTVGRFVTQEEDKIQRLRREMARELAAGFLSSMKKLGCTKQEAMSLLEQTKEEYHEFTGMSGTD